MKPHHHHHQYTAFGMMLHDLANTSMKEHTKDFKRKGFSSLPGAFVCHELKHPTHPFGVFYNNGGNYLTYSFSLMLLEISFVLISTRIIHFLLKPLKQPKIVAQVLGGMLIGPSFLGRNKKFGEFLFPKNADFMVKNIGVMGYMLFLFVSGVKMDLALVSRTGKKHIGIALASVGIPLILLLMTALMLQDSMAKELANPSSIGAVVWSMAITAFPDLYPLLEELKLVSSDLGRMALSTSIIIDAIGVNAVIGFEAHKQAMDESQNAGWYILSMVMVLGLILCIKRTMQYIVAKLQTEKAVDQTIIVLIILSALFMGFMTDLFGLAVANGPMWFGFMIPDGPPLGSTIVDRTQTIVSDILMPFSFTFIGMYTDVFHPNFVWSTLKPLVIIIIVGYVSKILSTFLTSLYFKMSLRDSLALSLTLSVRGQVLYLLFIHYMDKQLLVQPYFSLMVVLSTIMTAISAPLITLLYDPSKPYMVNKRRTIQHTPIGTELKILLVIHNQDTVSSLINLLKASNPTSTNPFSITALCLMELSGRANPVFIDHQKQREVPSQYANCLNIHNALQYFQESRSQSVKLQTFTIVTPKRTMYQDICEQAIIHKSTLIILPYSNDSLDSEHRLGVRSVNSFVLSNAPCSIGIFVDKINLRNPVVDASFGHAPHHFAVLFLGGADAREALTYADRMLGNPGIMLTVVRFLSFNGNGDDEMEKKLDDGMVTWFWVKNEENERLIYREVIVRNGAETIAAIKAINDGSFDLWIVGRQHGVNPVLLEGLSNWTENLLELGIIGDYVGTIDFGGSASVLVIQQQILRRHRNNFCLY